MAVTHISYAFYGVNCQTSRGYPFVNFLYIYALDFESTGFWKNLRNQLVRVRTRCGQGKKKSIWTLRICEKIHYSSSFQKIGASLIDSLFNITSSNFAFHCK